MQVWWGGHYAIIGSSDYFHVFTVQVAPPQGTLDMASPCCEAAGSEPCTLAVWTRGNSLDTLTTNSTCWKGAPE